MKPIFLLLLVLEQGRKFIHTCNSCRFSLTAFYSLLLCCREKITLRTQFNPCWTISLLVPRKTVVGTKKRIRLKKTKLSCCCKLMHEQWTPHWEFLRKRRKCYWLPPSCSFHVRSSFTFTASMLKTFPCLLPPQGSYLHAGKLPEPTVMNCGVGVQLSEMCPDWKSATSSLPFLWISYELLMLACLFKVSDKAIETLVMSYIFPLYSNASTDGDRLIATTLHRQNDNFFQNPV